MLNTLGKKMTVPDVSLLFHVFNTFPIELPQNATKQGFKCTWVRILAFDTYKRVAFAVNVTKPFGFETTSFKFMK